LRTGENPLVSVYFDVCHARLQHAWLDDFSRERFSRLRRLANRHNRFVCDAITWVPLLGSGRLRKYQDAIAGTRKESCPYFSQSKNISVPNADVHLFPAAALIMAYTHATVVLVVNQTSVQRMGIFGTHCNRRHLPVGKP